MHHNYKRYPTTVPPNSNSPRLKHPQQILRDKLVKSLSNSCLTANTFLSMSSNPKTYNNLPSSKALLENSKQSAKQALTAVNKQTLLHDMSSLSLKIEKAKFLLLSNNSR